MAGYEFVIEYRYKECTSCKGTGRRYMDYCLIGCEYCGATGTIVYTEVVDKIPIERVPLPPLPPVTLPSGSKYPSQVEINNYNHAKIMADARLDRYKNNNFFNGKLVDAEIKYKIWEYETITPYHIRDPKCNMPWYKIVIIEKALNERGAPNIITYS